MELRRARQLGDNVSMCSAMGAVRIPFKGE